MKSEFLTFLSRIETKSNSALIECVRNGYKICFEDGEEAAPVSDDTPVEDAGSDMPADDSAEMPSEDSSDGSMNLNGDMDMSGLAGGDFSDDFSGGSDFSGGGSAIPGGMGGSMPMGGEEDAIPMGDATSADEVNATDTAPTKVALDEFVQEFIQSQHYTDALQATRYAMENATTPISPKTELSVNMAREMGAFCNEKNYAPFDNDDISELVTKIVKHLGRKR